MSDDGGCYKEKRGRGRSVGPEEGGNATANGRAWQGPTEEVARGRRFEAGKGVSCVGLRRKDFQEEVTGSKRP